MQSEREEETTRNHILRETILMAIEIAHTKMSLQAIKVRLRYYFTYTWSMATWSR